MDKAKNAEFIEVLKSIPTQPFEPPTQAYLHEKFEQHKAALIGLDRLVEVHCATDGFEPGYVCMLCEKLCHVTDVLSHVTSKHHRRLCLDSVKNTSNAVAVALLERCKPRKAARIYEELNPRKNVSLMLTKSFDKVLLGCRQMPAGRIDDPTVACKPPQLQLAALELERANELAAKATGASSSSAHSQQIPRSRREARKFRRELFKEGLEAVVEMQPENESKYQPGYLCQTCVSRFASAAGIVDHLTSSRHQWMYLNLPQHAADLELTELLKCGPEDKAGVAKAAEYLERKNGRQCVSLVFEDRFDRKICNALRRRGDPGEIRLKKRESRKERQQQQRELRLAAKRKRKADMIDAPHGGQINEKSIDEEVANKKIKEAPLPAPCSGAFEIPVPALPVSKPYVGLFPPKSAMTWKAVGDFSFTKKNISSHEGGPVEQGVVQATSRRSWDAVAGQFLSDSGIRERSSISSSFGSTATAAFAHPRSASGSFQSTSQSNTSRFSSVSSAQAMKIAHPFTPRGATMEMPVARGTSSISSCLFPGIVTSQSTGAPQASYSKPRFGFFSRPTMLVPPQFPPPTPPAMVTLNPISSAAVSTLSNAIRPGVESSAPQVTAAAKLMAASKTSVLSPQLASAPESMLVSKCVFSAHQVASKEDPMLASNSDSSTPQAIPATDATMAASKISVSAPELDDLSLINDATETVVAALHECSAEQLMQLLLKEKEAAESRDRLIAKLANELLAKQSG